LISKSNSGYSNVEAARQTCFASSVSTISQPTQSSVKNLS
jgi:hypothetical protein